MKVTHVRRKVMLSALAGAIMIPGSAIRVKAADDRSESEPLLPVAGIESVLTECLETNVKDNIDLYLIPTKEGEYLNRAFANVKDFSYVRNAPNEKSEWTGKIYADSTVNVLEYRGDWTKIRSGNVEGYVPANALYTGEEAKKHAKEYETDVVTVLADVLNVRSGQGTENDILTQVMFKQQFEVTGEPESGWYPVKVDEFDGWVCGDYVEAETTFSYAETKEEEEQRLKEEAKQGTGTVQHTNDRLNNAAGGSSRGNERTRTRGRTNGTAQEQMQANRTAGAQTQVNETASTQANGTAGTRVQANGTTGAQTNGTAETQAQADGTTGEQANGTAGTQAQTNGTTGEQANGTTGTQAQVNGTAGAESDGTAGTQAQMNENAGTQSDSASGTQSQDTAQLQTDGTAEVQEAAVVENQGYAGQDVIDFACQFIGNPYVWGGTSLTNGADCSGFVQSVYANFGIALPRTTWDMVNVGYEVSYDQALPGDLVLYDGHVGLYMGDGTIVNAMNEAQGIGICSATYAPIITIRRVL